MGKNKIKYLFLGLILIVTVFLRTYHLSDRLVFDWDQERDANAVQTILQDHKPLLIGPRIMNDNGFMLGPYFFYLLTPFYLFTSLNPIALVIFIGVYSFLFILLSYFALKKAINETTALIFCGVWSFLPHAINIDTIAWNPLLVPIFIMIFIYFLGMTPFLKKRYWFIFGLIIGLAINTHVQLAILIPWAVYYFATKKDIKISWPFSPLAVLGILTSFVPLFIFDLRHNWINLQLFLNFIQSTNIQKNIFIFIPIWNNFINSVTGYNISWLPIFLWIFLGVIFIYFSKNNKIIKSIAIIWLIWPIAFAIYGKRPSEYYFNFTLPLIVLGFSLLLSKALKNVLVFFLIFVFFMAFSVDMKIIKPEKTSFSLANKIKVAEYIKSKVGNQKFNISYSVPSGYNSGYGYLLKTVNANPTNNPLDPLIQIIIPPQKDNKVFGGIGIKLPQTFLPQ